LEPSSLFHDHYLKKKKIGKERKGKKEKGITIRKTAFRGISWESGFSEACWKDYPGKTETFIHDRRSPSLYSSHQIPETYL